LLPAKIRPAAAPADGRGLTRRRYADKAGTQITPMNTDKTQIACLDLAKAPSFARRQGAVTGLLPAKIRPAAAPADGRGLTRRRYADKAGTQITPMNTDKTLRRFGSCKGTQLHMTPRRGHLPTARHDPNLQLRFYLAFHLRLICVLSAFHLRFICVSSAFHLRPRICDQAG
jgi:hypothetical protein